MIKYELRKWENESYIGTAGKFITALFAGIENECTDSQTIAVFETQQEAAAALSHYPSEIAETGNGYALLTVYTVEECEYDGDDFISSITVARSEAPASITLNGTMYHRTTDDGDYERE